MKKKIVALLVAMMCIASLFAGCGSSGGAAEESKGTYIVGSGGLTETKLVAELYSLALEDNGYTVSIRTTQEQLTHVT